MNNNIKQGTTGAARDARHMCGTCLLLKLVRYGAVCAAAHVRSVRPKTPSDAPSPCSITMQTAWHAYLGVERGFMVVAVDAHEADPGIARELVTETRHVTAESPGKPYAVQHTAAQR
jgi:hypothetical protein